MYRFGKVPKLEIALGDNPDDLSKATFGLSVDRSAEDGAETCLKIGCNVFDVLANESNG